MSADTESPAVKDALERSTGDTHRRVLASGPIVTMDPQIWIPPTADAIRRP